MTHLGTLHGYQFTTGSDIDDIRGSNVYGLEDKKLGKIHDVIFDHTTGDIRYVVVDTGGLLSSKKFIIPADRLSPSIENENDYSANLTKEQVEAFPPYDEEDVGQDDRWNNYETRYQAVWTATPVQHRVGSERNLTPNLGTRWSRFENRLRQNRETVISGCEVCDSAATRQRKVS